MTNQPGPDFSAIEARAILHTLDDPALMKCSKCGFTSGNDWSQCNGSCPMPMSPHYDRAQPKPATGIPRGL